MSAVYCLNIEALMEFSKMNRQYFKSWKEAANFLKKNKMFRSETTNSYFDYNDEMFTKSAGIRSDIIGYWIEYRFHL